MIQIMQKKRMWVLICVLATLLMAVLCGQNFGYDWRHYHYYNGYAFWHQRWLWDFRPAGFHSYLNPLLDAVNYQLLTHFPHAVAAMIIAAWQGLAYGLAWCVAALLLSTSRLRHWRVWALAFVLLGLYTPTITLQLGGFNNDLIDSVFVLFALYLWLRLWVVSPGKWYQFLLGLAGFSMGAAVGFKLTMAPIAVAWFVVALCLPPPGLNRWRVVFCIGVGAALGFLLTNGWWMWHWWQVTGNPVYPAFNQWFKAPGWAHVSAFDQNYKVRHWYQLLYYPLLVLVHPKQVQPKFFVSLLYPLLYLSLIYMGLAKMAGYVRGKFKTFFAGYKNPSLLFVLLSFCVLAYVLSMLFFSTYRYLCAVTLLVPVLLLVLMNRFFKGPVKVYVFFALWTLILSTTRLSVPLRGLVWQQSTPFFLNKSVDASSDRLGLHFSKPHQLPKHALVLMAHADMFTNIIASMPVGWRFINMTHGVWSGGVPQLINYPPSDMQIKSLQRWVRVHSYPVYLLTFRVKPTVRLPDNLKPYVSFMKQERRRMLHQHGWSVVGHCVDFKTRFVLFYPELCAIKTRG